MTKRYIPLALAFLATPLAAHEGSTEIMSSPSPADYAASQAVVEPVLAELEAGDTDAAIELITSQSEIFASKKAEVNVLAGQVRTVYEIYGPVTKCIMSEREHASELRIKYTYVCQHRELLVRWNFAVDNVPKGWIITNFRFSDTF